MLYLLPKAVVNKHAVVFNRSVHFVSLNLKSLHKFLKFKHVDLDKPSKDYCKLISYSEPVIAVHPG